MSLEEGTVFLFTSESVNEGHPGKEMMYFYVGESNHVGYLLL